MRMLRLTLGRSVVATLLYLLLWQVALAYVRWAGPGGTRARRVVPDRPGLAGMGHRTGRPAHRAAGAARAEPRPTCSPDADPPRAAGSGTRSTRRPGTTADTVNASARRWPCSVLYSLAFFGLYMIGLPSAAQGNGAMEPHELPEGGGSRPDRRADGADSEGDPEEVRHQSVQLHRLQRARDRRHRPEDPGPHQEPVPGRPGGYFRLRRRRPARATAAPAPGMAPAPDSAPAPARAKIRFVRLKHSDRAWDKNFGIGGDMNLLSEYGSRTRQKIGEQTEYLEIAQLSRFEERQGPPLVFVAGRRRSTCRRTTRRSCASISSIITA